MGHHTGHDHEHGQFPLRGKRVFVAGHAGLVGSALARRLRTEGCTVLTVQHGQLDLTRQLQTERWMRAERPDAVFVAAARVGGIAANARYPVEFLYENIMIAGNIIHAAHETGVRKLLWLGSSCIYPRNAPQPIREEMLLTGALEATNEAYAIAKIAGLKLAQFYNKQYGDCFISAMPTNLYGPNDNFDPETSHVLPALIRRIHEAKMSGLQSVTLWGTGTPLREFLHVDDLADACVYLMKNYSGCEHVNIGAGEEISIRDLASLIAEIVGYRGSFAYDTTKPDGTPRKRLDTSRMEAMGWHAGIGLREGISDLYARWLTAIEKPEIAAVA
ncbi:GDP-fucose synthetase [Phyllobacterium phragmitis]|uniref:GDP-L-fucose synthase n=2 Tax=Phyllobacterium phragmitis TaxID=2670329 RepID=A0A2S9IMD7_9HYPH|nr:GDP-L-fucose synthase [Phyllobacterium phragmitis]PRD41691.1 GDP-fucose synthetase [Phyllobacterium phragmitis]